MLLPADIPLAAAPGEEKGPLKQALDRVLDAVPAGHDAVHWVASELAARALERCAGDLKEAAGMLGIAAPDLRKLLAESRSDSMETAGGR